MLIPDRLEHVFDGIDIPKPTTFDEDYEITGKKGLVGTAINVETFSGGMPLFENSWEKYVKAYYRAAQSIDGSVGTVLDAIKAAGIENNTIVIYTSDHGYHNGEHHLTEKHYTYRYTMHIPMIVRYPNAIQPGTVSDDLVSGIDVAPTILDACGVPIPSEMDGESWLPLFKNGGCDPHPREEIFSALNSSAQTTVFRVNTCVRTKQHKLIYFPTLDHYELYDVQADPDEMHNLAYNDTNRELFADMKNRLEKCANQAGWSLLETHPPQRLLLSTGPCRRGR